MTDNTHPDAGSTHIIRYALELGLLWIDGDGRDKVREALDALDALEAQLESIRAGGVSGPLMGQPQEMPDLSALTERGAKAWAGVDAQGLRDGVASAGSEPVAVRDAIAHFRLTHWADEDGGLGLADALSQLYGDDDIGRANEELDALADAISEVVTHPSSPEGMVGGWMPIETAPVAGLILLVVEDSAGERRVFPAEASHENGVRVWQVTLGWLGWTRLHSGWTPILWRRLPTPPTTSAGSKGE